MEEHKQPLENKVESDSNEHHEHSANCCGQHHDHHHDDDCCEHHHEHGDSYCDHHHDHHHEAQTMSFNVGGGVALCRLSSHEEANIVSCTLELENTELELQSLAAALAGVATDIEEAGGLIGHIKCAAQNGESFARISVTQAGIDPFVESHNLKILNEETDISLALIVFAVEHEQIISALLVHLKHMF